ncbi:PREDICTED: neurogenic locus notch homolog protein 1-like, partial [Leptosomus discolor]|uniref:neurogenic locus notch homolog protein 1-like n=1 Tax=Leptosomus discolor TaxID=188344 RepID=UPI0005227599
FSGAHCEIDIDECNPDPCHYGTCKDSIAAFTCLCQPGYMGHRCDININECQSQPCKNGGTCQDRNNAYNCLCLKGTTGEREGHPPQGLHARHPQSHPCPRGGLALSRCQQPPWCRSWPEASLVKGEFSRFGAWLSQELRPSREPGSCWWRRRFVVERERRSVPGIDKITGYECTCEPGYTGHMCNINIDECASNPCHNGGTCKDGINGFTCLCPEGFHDPKCLSEVNECNSNPCIHGKCHDGLNGYRCDCDSGWSGTNCDINNNECESNPCMNGGTCKDMTSGYICTCREGFSGPNCQTNINECASNPCLNQGTCIDDVAGYTCNCLLPYT